jgi:hypothetical protein
MMWSQELCRMPWWAMPSGDHDWSIPTAAWGWFIFIWYTNSVLGTIELSWLRKCLCLSCCVMYPHWLGLSCCFSLWNCCIKCHSNVCVGVQVLLLYKMIECTLWGFLVIPSGFEFWFHSTYCTRWYYRTPAKQAYSTVLCLVVVPQHHVKLFTGSPSCSFCN